MEHWRDAFSEEAGTHLDSNNLRSLREMVDSEIWCLRDHWREKVREAYGRYGDNQLYSRRKIDIELHLENCTKALQAAIAIPRKAVSIPSFQKLKAYNRIESLVEFWKIALYEAAEISRLVVQHYRGITDNEINYIEKHARDALREAVGISGVVILNSR
ncbi:uncharacterized protein HKW66_Vig0201460 [Vigna angularis]|uniref:Uncharacterized protein n=1 Tax=Phaseolus angularis TaxID=3914 RepID=A0A8T0JRP2_PHAAN|nr:uncharacterized protein HKW66_Vig0201460 [Vigna angularis]